jgi:RNA polymerase sigma-70 factor (ECF subfamily)
MVRRTAWSLGGSEDLDDIVQEVFVRVWKSWGQFRGLADRRTWVYRITVNTARGHWRGRGRLKAALSRFLFIQTKSEAVEGGQGAWEHDAALAQALTNLDAGHREALTLVHLEGLSLAEAAEALEIPEGTVKSRLFHARAVLRARLKEDGHEG